MLIAHRGTTKGLFPDNTVEGCLKLVSQGVSALEVDIRFNHFNGTLFLAHGPVHQRWRRRQLMAELIDYLPEKTLLFAELKTWTIRRSAYAKAAIEVVRKAGKENQVKLMSYNPMMIWQLKKLGYRGEVGLLIGSRLIWQILKKMQSEAFLPDFVLISKRLASDKIIKWLEQKSIEHYLHVVNKVDDYLIALERGFKGVISDNCLDISYNLQQNGETLEMA